MGFLVTDLNVLSSTGPTVLIPTAKDVQAKAFQVSRTNTVAADEVVLAADASVIGVKFYKGTASDAGTTATVTINLIQGGVTISTGSVDVKGAAGTTAEVQMTNLPNLQPVPLTGDIHVQAVYAETGTASTTGGPWNFLITFVR